jgi:hypothetical protein
MQPAATRDITRVELLVVLLVVVWLLTIAVGMLNARSHAARLARAQRIYCVSNLQQLALGLRLWANDHGDKFPWQVSTNQGGTLEYADSVEVWRHFQAASNKLNISKILACPADISRGRTPQRGALNNTNISYLISMDFDPSKPGRMLAGDRFVSTNNKVMSGLLINTNGSTLRWVTGGHRDAGNFARTDGSVVGLSIVGLRDAFSNRTVRLAIP